MTPNVIVDTDVLVSALIRRRSSSPTVLVLGAIVANRVRPILSTDLIDEYIRVLERPTLRRLHGLDSLGLTAFLASLERRAEALEPPRAPESAPDPRDQHLWDLLSAHREAILITGDQLLLDRPPAFGRVMTPRQLVEAFVGDASG